MFYQRLLFEPLKRSRWYQHKNTLKFVVMWLLFFLICTHQNPQSIFNRVVGFTYVFVPLP